MVDKKHLYKKHSQQFRKDKKHYLVCTEKIRNILNRSTDEGVKIMSNLTSLAPEIKAVCSLSIILCCQEGKPVISIAFSYGDYQKLAKKIRNKMTTNKQPN